MTNVSPFPVTHKYNRNPKREEAGIEPAFSINQIKMWIGMVVSRSMEEGEFLKYKELVKRVNAKTPFPGYWITGNNTGKLFRSGLAQWPEIMRSNGLENAEEGRGRIGIRKLAKS